MSEEKDKKEKKNEDPVEWGSKDGKLVEMADGGSALEKAKDSKRKR